MGVLGHGTKERSECVLPVSSVHSYLLVGRSFRLKHIGHPASHLHRQARINDPVGRVWYPVAGCS